MKIFDNFREFLFGFENLILKNFSPPQAPLENLVKP